MVSNKQWDLFCSFFAIKAKKTIDEHIIGRQSRDLIQPIQSGCLPSRQEKSSLFKKIQCDYEHVSSALQNQMVCQKINI
jgi:hypothetical protein